MNDFLPPCEALPNLLLTVAWGIGVGLFIATIRPKQPEPTWRWGDPPRRPHRLDPYTPVSFIAAALAAAFAISFAVNHPICG